ncbi:Uma2 family endonuclease [Planktothrix mougeotii]|uniref:Uma2 family endonuclease n=1 Tax=Planktothrix mougeotii LEGE 06226 TaxID=1828728 RepID=A0ABR9UJR9_9CYAN|nr:Uma2 family endonuclease [Planktothrix mougeotii]MBE9145814.1 Uma2 family endonuclease [Planktothrix mougeotii LEGE 06226]
MGLSSSLLSVNIPSTVQLIVTPEQFMEIAIANRDLKLERTATGELIVMPPTGGITGKKNIDIEGQLWLWNRQTKLGQVFNSSTGFLLPKGANRSPDAAWIRQDRWEQLTLEQQEGFPPLAPDFVLELRSKTDSLKTLQEKMQEYLENGVRLGWLIDRQHQTVSIYRPNQNIEILEQPLSLSGEDVLPGFILDLTEIWQ